MGKEILLSDVFESGQRTEIALNPAYLDGVRRLPPGVRRVYPLRLDKELSNLNYSPKTDFLRQGWIKQKD